MVCIFQIIFDNNEIHELAPNTFADMENLTNVDLTNNKIQKFPLNSLTINTQLESGAQIQLLGNPVVCDCEMEWIQRIPKLAAESPK